MNEETPQERQTRANEQAAQRHNEQRQEQAKRVAQEYERMDSAQPTPTQSEIDLAATGYANVGGVGVRNTVEPGQDSGRAPGAKDGNPNSPALRNPADAREAEDGKITRDVNTNSRGAVAPTTTGTGPQGSGPK